MLNILIIDDSEVVRDGLSVILSDLNNVKIVGVAENALKGIQLINLYKPDFVILDIEMPGKSGIDILPDIKHNEPVPHIAVITNYPYPSYRKHCMKLGADYFFDKAFEFNKVRSVVENLSTNSA